MLAMRCAFRVDGRGRMDLIDQDSAIELKSAKVGNAQYDPTQLAPLTLKNWAEPRVLPLMPIWRGWMMNTLFYAAAGLAIYSVLRLLRRLQRSHRGACPACGYDLRVGPSVGCPECGWRRP